MLQERGGQANAVARSAARAQRARGRTAAPMVIGILQFELFIRGGESLKDKRRVVQSLKDHVLKELGKIAVPQEIDIVPSLPKTRSGKIMRRVLKAKELGQDVGDISTIED